MKYSDKTLSYYNNLKMVGEFSEDAINIGTGIVGSPLCGDVMKIQIMFDENDKIINAKHKVFGCVSAIASMELACELLKGLSIEQARKIENLEVASELELNEIKKHCSVLAKEAINAAIDNYLEKKNEKKREMITISDYAMKKLKELILVEGKKCKGVRIVINNEGCSGINYALSYEMEGKEPSYNVNGIDFFYYEEDYIFINGLEIDVIENSLGIGFVITNKNQISCKNCNCKCA